MPKFFRSGFFRVFSCISWALFLAGCSTYTEKSSGRDAAYRSGNLASAVSRADADAAKNSDNKDTILYRLEQGAILRAAALAPDAAPEAARDYLARSNAALDAAEKRVNDYEAAARVKVGSELGALFTNQANTPYRGRSYDKVMLNTLKALNWLQLGDSDRARVELNRALQRQRDAVEENARRIEEAESAARAAARGQTTGEQGRAAPAYDVDRAKADPYTGASLNRIAASAESAAALQPYADYVNPFSVLLDGLYFAACGVDGADLERSRKSLERVAGMAPGNTFVRADLADVSAGRRPSGVTYVVFETGSGPWRDQVRIDIPLFIVTNAISYVGAAFPELKYNGGYLPAISVDTTDAAGSSVTPALVCSMDAVVARDFKNEWPAIVTRTLIATATRATLDAVIQKQAKDEFGDAGRLLTQLFTSITQIAINIADTRTWRSLPKEFYYARLATPADRVLVIKAGNQAHRIQVGPGDVTVVYVKSIAAGTPLLVSQFQLK
ncbi:hypothetical protein OpiT1DRAFT_04068 [Opitutaceae bacterium TAV1]|nr:hypothetical protein OpiT1DRAFT_04068 [Opitutaceae bacterium TAV1]